MRTGLTALAAGIGARALLEGVVSLWLAMAAGSLLILFSAFRFLAPVWRQMLNMASPCPDTPRLPSGILIVPNGFLALVSVAALIGIWAARRPG